jgi:hypothetical protein
MLGRVTTIQRLTHLRRIERVLRASRWLPLPLAWTVRLRRLLDDYHAVRTDQYQKLRWTLQHEGLRRRAVADWLWRERQAVHAHARTQADATERPLPQSF